MAFFRNFGTVPAESDTLMTFVRAGSKSSVHSKRSDVGIQSRSHVFGDIFNIVLRTVSSVTTSNRCGDVPEKDHS